MVKIVEGWLEQELPNEPNILQDNLVDCQKAMNIKMGAGALLTTFHFSISDEWTKLVRVLNYTRIKRLVGDKHSSL